jgi:ubiquinone/menaquinone biosynthesis C-methylase UbiE
MLARALPSFWSSDLNRAVVELVDPAPGHVLLDLGAGLGPATVEAATRVAPNGRVIAIEPSPGMRAVLHTRRRWQASPGSIEVLDGVAEELPVAADSVDVVWAVNATHHFDDIARAASELVRVLKVGGRVFLVEEEFARPDHPSHAADPEQVGALLDGAGLEAAFSRHQPLGDTTATIITATKLR